VGLKPRKKMFGNHDQAGLGFGRKQWSDASATLRSALCFEAMNSSHVISGNRRLFALTSLMSAFVLLIGCSKTPEQRTVDAASKRYGRIEVGMSKQEVVAKLGEPASKQAFRYRWETDAGRELKVALELRFDNGDKVASVATTRVSRD
jgi:hypothetical protein